MPKKKNLPRIVGHGSHAPRHGRFQALAAPRLWAVAAALTLAASGLHAADHKAPHAATDGAQAPVAARQAVVTKAAATATPAVNAAEVDSIERLRQRLSEKLITDKAAEARADQLEVHVRSKAPVAHKPEKQAGAPSKKHARSQSAAARGDAPAGKHAAHWSYGGPAGPQTWGGLRPEFKSCAHGQLQSPIDIQGGLAVDLEPVRFDYRSSSFAVVDNGHTVQANLPSGQFIEVGGGRYELKQFHFHRPSEERIDGRQFDMSLHLVHKDADGRLAVVALLLGRGEAPHPTVQKVWNNLPLEKDLEVPARVQLELGELLPADTRYFTYMGSLTTPPCSEGVRWIVMRQPVVVSQAQIDLFARLYPMNARPIQQVAGRRILQSQ